MDLSGLSLDLHLPYSEGDKLLSQDGGFLTTTTLGTLEIAGLKADITASSAPLDVTVGALEVTGLAATVLVGEDITATAGDLEVTGLAATVLVGEDITATAGAVEVTGLTATVLLGEDITATAGAVEVTGLTATVTAVAPYLRSATGEQNWMELDPTPWIEVVTPGVPADGWDVPWLTLYDGTDTYGPYAVQNLTGTGNRWVTVVTDELPTGDYTADVSTPAYDGATPVAITGGFQRTNAVPTGADSVPWQFGDGSVVEFGNSELVEHYQVPS